MALCDYIQRIKRIDQLIRLKATGTPQEFADKLEISKRNLYSYINLMKDLRANIQYSKMDNTYFYAEKGKLIIGFQCTELTEKEQISTRGGLFFNKKAFFFQSAVILHSNCFNLHLSSKIELTL